MAIDRSTAQSNISVEAAADKIDAILADDPDYADDQPAEPKKGLRESKREARIQQEPEPEAEADAEEDDVSEEAETEEDQPEAESESEVAELDYDTLITVKSKDDDGKEVEEEIPLKDLIRERMLQRDYTRKTQELAKQRAEVEQEKRRGVDNERAQYIEALEAQQALVYELIAPEFSNLDQLAEADPAAYIRAQHKLRKVNDVVKQIEDRKQQAIQERRNHLLTEVLPREMELVKQKIPTWSDSMKPVLIETGERFGYSKDEMSQIMDHRQLHILHELHRLTEAEKTFQQRKEVARKKVVEKPKVVKSGGNQKQRKGGDSYKRLRQSGRVEDAAAYFLDTDLV